MNDQSVPFEWQIWDAKACAAYLGQSYHTFIGKTQYLPSFPKRCPMPGHPKWQAKLIAEWATGQVG